MEDKEYDIGIVGLGVMGANLGLNIASRGRQVAGYNRSAEKAHRFTQRGAIELKNIPGAHAWGTDDLRAFAAALKTPRVCLLMVPASAVDDAIAEIRPFLEAGDIIIDGGNSHFPDTERRLEQLAKDGLHFIGMGVSGGEEGARHGPSMMPGGEEKAWERVRPLLEPAAAKAPDGTPCVAWMGRGGAGHFVKMVHNGIEYAQMQLIAESYDLMRRGLGLELDAIQQRFAAWNRGPLASYLIEITADILQQRDEDGSYLLDHIKDAARQKGTGRWTTEAALALGIPTPTIDAAVTARGLSDFFDFRQHAAKTLTGVSPEGRAQGLRAAGLPERLEEALLAGMILSYAQGMQLIGTAASEYAYGTSLETVAGIWRGGCIIRAALLEEIRAAYRNSPKLENLIVDPGFVAKLGSAQAALREIAAAAARAGIPAPAHASALAYYDALISARLPANLIQAQRDYFGAHTYERLDRPGTFHTLWTKAEK